MDEIIIDEHGNEEVATDLVIRRDGPLVVPAAVGVVGEDIRVRPGDLNDLDAVDKLQKGHSDELGFLQRKALEGKVENRELFVAETTPTHARPAEFAGYVIGSDTYFKREEVGVVYQMAVMPTFRRRNVGGVLLQHMFDAWPWGTRLCCAWCAQDLAANRFWEAMGFVAVAYRAGGGRREEGRGMREEGQKQKRSGVGPSSLIPPPSSLPGPRVHIFWQKRVHVGDTQTPWWYPSVTGAGAMREDRIVLPIPEGGHWGNTRPMVLPELPATPHDQEIEKDAVETDDPSVPEEELVGKKRWPEGIEEREDGLYEKGKRLMTAEMMRAEQGSPPRGVFMKLPGTKLVKELPRPLPRKRKKARRVKRKHDPRLMEAARDLRDRWLSYVNTKALLLPTAAKYEVGRRKMPVTPDAFVLPMPTRDEVKRLAA